MKRSEATRRRLDLERFWRNVTRSEGCWLWRGRVDPRWGYGLFSVSRAGVEKKWKAHRYAWEAEVGPIPDGMSVLHSCDTPACVRPDHLHLGDHQQNMDEMYARGRGRKAVGEDHHSAKLTEDDVREIRRRYAAGGVTQPQLSREFGVAQGVIWSLLHRRTWAHVE